MSAAWACRRRAVLRGLVAGALAPALPGAALAERFAGAYDPQAEAIDDGLWLVRGADEPISFANGGAIANCAILASDDGAILFDPGASRGEGRALDALAKRLTGKAVARVYISHLHPDHALGAAAFAPAMVHALPATRAGLEREGEALADGMYRLLADWMKGTDLVLPRPDVRAGPLVFGGRSIELVALDGHTSGDLALIDHATGTLLAGDLVFHDRAPATPHADLAAWRAALDRLEALPHRLLVPGHGPPDASGTHRAIAQTRDWLGWLEETLRDCVKRGLDMGEAGEVPIPARFSGMKAARYELQRSVSHFYPAMEASLLPRL